ncbi:phospholipase D3-like isoform X2 [Rhinatrema bivittatum]|uniref:phospholipase D3-like isoform X2 n=1 Tax=Rhinatrema bivittatum TaxID=194408 RepID=UPI00112A78E9|nr:phospholipase D3-like isoform X2 [Rhinatrema bivittatum]
MKKESVPEETPVRRSSRLQTELASEDMLIAEVEAQDAPLIQPRSSIKAHRLQPATSESQPDTESTQLFLKEEPGPTATRNQKSFLQFPRVMLKRLEIPEKGEDKERKREVKEEKKIMTNSTPIYSSDLGKKEKLLTPASDWRMLRERKAPKLPDAAEPRRKMLGDVRKRVPCALLCVYLLPCLLILGGASWYLWEYGVPSSVLTIPAQMQQSWSDSALLWRKWQQEEGCGSHCRFLLVESIPENLHYGPGTTPHVSVYRAWVELLESANSSVDIAAFYFTLRDTDTQGKDVLEKLLALPSRGVKLSIVVNSPQKSSSDTEDLTQKGADVKYLDFQSLTGGILHTKLWIVDRKHIYIGSANMDWRSLTQVKELGAVMYNCSCLARDLHKVFQMYRYLGEEGVSIPSPWPTAFSADSNHAHPLHVPLNNSAAKIYISSSPSALCSEGRTSDLTAVLSIIDDAKEFIYISVMDYVPQCQFCNPKRFWPAIDDQLRAAACDRGVVVRLLVSCWPHSEMSMFVFLKSLDILSQEPLGCPIQVKVFIVPVNEEQRAIPYSRVNHNKYTVTDRIAYIGTSNWSEDYFVNTAGVGLIINQTATDTGDSSSVRGQLEAVFVRDWDSSYTHPLHSKMNCNTEAGSP